MTTVITDSVPPETSVALNSLSPGAGFFLAGKHYIVVSATEQFNCELKSVAAIAGTTQVFPRNVDSIAFGPA